MSSYPAPWSKTVKIATHVTNAVLIGIGLTLLLSGLFQIIDGQPLGWLIAAGSLGCWLILFLVPMWAPRGYRIGDAAVFVCKKVGDEKLPFSNIASIEIWESREVFASTIRVMGSGGYYGTFCTFRGGALSSFRALATNEGPLVVLRMKRGDSVALSPENPHDFVRELSCQAGVQVQEKEMPAQATSTYIPPTRCEKALEFIALILLFVTFAAVIYFWGKLPKNIPAHFDALGKPNDWGPKNTILILPGFALGMYVLLTALTTLVSRKNKVPDDHPNAQRMVVLVRCVLGITKCFILGIATYIIWQTGFTAIGKSQGLGVGFTVVGLLIGVIAEPIMLIIMALYSSKVEDP